MKFFLDENFPKSAALIIAARGHECIESRGTGQKGSDDETIFCLAQQAGAVFLTTDRDFFYTIPLLAQNHHGVVVVALHQPNRGSILKRREWFLKRFGAKDIKNRVFELRDSTYLTFPPAGMDD